MDELQVSNSGDSQTRCFIPLYIRVTPVCVPYLYPILAWGLRKFIITSADAHYFVPEIPNHRLDWSSMIDSPSTNALPFCLPS